MNVIVVDDELNPLKNFIESIVDYGDIKCSMFMNDIDAVFSYVKSNPVDIAFLDVVLPNTNGIDIAKRLVKIKPQIKIVFLTGYLQKEEALNASLGENMAGVLYKPYTKDALRLCLASIDESLQNKRHVFAKTFGEFDLSIDGTSIAFSLSKSKELLAYLVYRQGQTVSMSEIIAALWSDHDVEKSKLLYRNAKSRLVLLLRQYKIEHILKYSRGNAGIDLSCIDCDLTHFLTHEEDVSYNYEFLINYDWSVDMQNRLDITLEKRLKKA